MLVKLLTPNQDISDAARVFVVAADRRLQAVKEYNRQSSAESYEKLCTCVEHYNQARKSLLDFVPEDQETD